MGRNLGGKGGYLTVTMKGRNFLKGGVVSSVQCYREINKIKRKCPLHLPVEVKGREQVIKEETINI